MKLNKKNELLLLETQTFRKKKRKKIGNAALAIEILEI